MRAAHAQADPVVPPSSNGSACEHTGPSTEGNHGSPLVVPSYEGTIELVAPRQEPGSRRLRLGLVVASSRAMVCNCTFCTF